MAEITDVPIWVLNLKRDTDKLHLMQDHLQGLGVKYRIIEAVDGSLLTPEDVKYYSKSLALTDFGRELTPGEIGCALSHIHMWELMLEENFNEVLVLEDDVRISRSLIDILENRDQLPQNFEHINFSTSAAQNPFGEFITDIHRASYHMERPFSTGGYLITRKGAKKLLKLVYPLYMPIDNFVSISDIISYGVYPKVAIHLNLGSNIGKRGKIAKPVFWLRKFQEFKEILKAVAIFFGFSRKSLINIHLQINHMLGKLHRR